jgi:hypothetical protein
MRTPRALVILCVILGAGSWTRLGAEYLEGLRPNTRPNPDYFQDWASARNPRVGLPVYTPHSTTIPLYLGRPPRGVERETEYNAHPPMSVLLALPLAGLDFPDAMLAWNLISLAAFVASLAILARAMPELKALFLPVGALLPFCLPVYGNFQQGQLTLVLVGLVTASWALDRSGRPGAAGALLGLAAAVKLFPAYLVLDFAGQRRWRALMATAVSFAVLTLATAMVLGLEPFRDYLNLVLPEQETVRSWWCNFSIAGLWHRLFAPTPGADLPPALWSSPALACWGTILSDLVVTAILVAVSARARTPARRDIASAVAVSAMLLVSPVTWDISMVFLLLPIAVIARTVGKARWMAVPLALILLAIWLPQGQLTELILAGQTIPVASPAFLLGPASAKFYALLGVFLLGLAAFRAGTRPEPVTGRE